ncbi:hypothetical protein IscW_ISCW009301 [Ixodes scapularis]|uniref:Uncharacterized protein n=1 Tax=Ixodes scapularis TaxID=6945 RepID=B7PZ36_IXOSC|nr:hypothetical protein IscW_ISCW009301 [Ixodes scapularis]|eukprot:XP_002404644.1 hypothetical protein IscW_ISCW009301 [Ixodes scapularis]
MTGMPAARWGGYPRLFTEKTSSLLNEALQMLHRAKDIRERRWLQMYVQRLATLSGDLERSTTNFGSPSTVPSPQRRSQQQTVPTTGQISPPPSPSASKMKTRTTTQGSVREVARELGKPEEVTKPNFLNEYDPLAGQLHQQAAHESRLRVTTETYSLDAGGHVPMRPTTPVVADDMSRLIRKIQSMAGLDVTQEEVMRMFPKRNARFDGVGQDSGDGEKASTRPTSAPTRPPIQGPTSPPARPAKAAADRRLRPSGTDVDDLVLQLEREKFLPDRSADSWDSPEVGGTSASESRNSAAEGMSKTSIPSKTRRSAEVA